MANTFLNIALGMIVMVFIVAMFRALLGGFGNWSTTVVEETWNEPDDERESTVDGYTLQGNVHRKQENGQWFVMDPVDGKKMFLNDSDTMYEDAKGLIWRVV